MHPHYREDWLVRILLMDSRKDKECSAFVLCGSHCWLCEICWESVRLAKPAKAGSKKWDSEVKPKENQKAFWKEKYVWSEHWSHFLFPSAGRHSTDMLVCHHLGHLASPVLNLKHLFTPGVLSLQLLFQR